MSGASTIGDCEAQIVQLELILDAKVLSPCSQNLCSFEISEFFEESQVCSKLMSISYMLSQVYIVEDRNELESFSPGATIVNKYYDPYLFDLDDLESKLQTLFKEVI